MIPRLILAFVLLPSVSIAQQQDSLAHDPAGIDEQLFIGINHWGNSAQWLDPPATTLSNTAFYTVAAIPIGLYGYGLLTPDNAAAHAGVSTLLSVGVASAITEGIKRIVRRPRPYHAVKGWRTPDTLLLPKDYSFPSGHATATWALATGLALHYQKWYVIAPAAMYALSVSLSRPYVAAHYPSDIFVGALIGTATSFLIWRVESDLFKNAGKALNPAPASIVIPIVTFSQTI
jgi:membrane-associated phospholipid phosphatase